MNRALVTLRRYLGWLAQQGVISANPAQAVKELRRQQLAPKGLERPIVRRLLREVELREDIRATAIFASMLYTGARVSDVVNLDLPTCSWVNEAARRHSGSARATNKAPCHCLFLPDGHCWLTLTLAHLCRPAGCSSVNVGALTERGIRALCEKYAALIGVKLHPHLFRHTMAHQFLQTTATTWWGWRNFSATRSLNTTSRYCKQTQEQLAQATERLTY